MLLKTNKEKAALLLEEGAHLLREVKLPELAEKAEELKRGSEAKENPTVMFYGLYNAGKSTLINALCKQEIAQVGDIPTTVSVQSIPWSGYTLVDTPGIQAQSDHTQIAVKEIDSSDLILFIMDNEDGYERESVYRAIMEILSRGKPLAIVINQKSIDESEDPELFVPELPSMKRLMGRVAENLRRQGLSIGKDILSESKNFLGIFMVNAQTAVDASLSEDEQGAKLLYANSGITTLVNAMDKSIRETSRLQMLITPLQNLKTYLQEALSHYQGPEQEEAERKLTSLLQEVENSRQRSSAQLLSEGLRKIEACYEEIRRRGSNGQPFDELPGQLEKDLQSLLQEIMTRESEFLQVKVDNLNLPETTVTPETGTSITELAKTLSDIIIIIKTPLPPHIKILLVVGAALKALFGKSTSKKQAEEDEARIAAYYKWLNDLRDSEMQTKAAYQDAVDNLIREFYAPKLQVLTNELSQASEASALHTEYAGRINDLMFRTGEMIAEIALGKK